MPVDQAPLTTLDARRSTPQHSSRSSRINHRVPDANASAYFQKTDMIVKELVPEGTKPIPSSEPVIFPIHHSLARLATRGRPLRRGRRELAPGKPRRKP
jgi:hypothetical protein